MLQDQPAPVPVPVPFAGPRQDYCQLEKERPRPTTEKDSDEKSAGPARVDFGFPMKKRCRSSSAATIATTSRRPRISAPSDFRHLNSESFPFPQYGHLQHVSRRPPSPPDFRPIELSICTPGKPLSPILPLFEFPTAVTPPPSAHVLERPNNYGNLNSDRSYSPMSFHVPRKLTASPTMYDDERPPEIPPKSRARAYTSPNLEKMKERIACAMIEVEKLQKEIDSVVERQSIRAASSRPSTAHSATPLGKPALLYCAKVRITY